MRALYPLQPFQEVTALQKKKNVNKLFASNPKSNFEIIFYLEKDKLFPPAKKFILEMET